MVTRVVTVSRFKKIGQNQDADFTGVKGSIERGGREWKDNGLSLLQLGLQSSLNSATGPPTLLPMGPNSYQGIKSSLRQLYPDDHRPWLVGFSGKDSTMVASLLLDAVLSIPPEQRKKPVAILCTDTRVEIPAVEEGVEGALERMRRCSQHHISDTTAVSGQWPPHAVPWARREARRHVSG